MTVVLSKSRKKGTSLARTANQATVAGRFRTACVARLLPLLLLLLSVLAVKADQYEGFCYTTNGNTVTLTNYTGSGGDVTIPDTINDLPVTSIVRRGVQPAENC